MLTLVLEPEIEQRVAQRAKSRGMSGAEFVRALIEASLDELDDLQMAVERLEHPLPPLTSAAQEQGRRGDSGRMFGDWLAASPLTSEDRPQRHAARRIRRGVFD